MTVMANGAEHGTVDIRPDPGHGDQGGPPAAPAAKTPGSVRPPGPAAGIRDAQSGLVTRASTMPPTISASAAKRPMLTGSLCTTMPSEIAPIAPMPVNTA